MKDQLIRFTSSFEGYVNGPYLDVCNIRTYYFGHVPRSGDNPELLSEPYTLEKGQELLWLDLQKALRAVHSMISYALSEPQVIAVTDFCYNLGSACLHRSSVRAKLNRGDIDAAADAMLLYRYAGGRIIPGLAHRRDKERRLFLS